MQTKLISCILCFIGLNFYAQHTVTGTIKSNDYLNNDVEVSNLKRKTTSKTDIKGNFKIEAEIGEELLFFKKNHQPLTFKITQKHFNENLRIYLNKNSIFLDEVLIAKAPKLKIQNNYDALKNAEIYKEQQQAKVVGVYDGKIPNGMDLIGIAGKTVNLIKKVFKIEQREPKMTFDQLISKNINSSFWTDQLKLKEEEIQLFLEFCKRDKAGFTLTETSTELDYIAYFIKKRKEYNPNY